jgi:hypothetical protein
MTQKSQPAKRQHPHKVGDNKTMYCAVKKGDFLHHFVANNQGDHRVYGWRCQGCDRIVPVNEVKRRF